MLSKPGTKKIIVLHIVTLGLYFFYWCAQSRRDVNQAARRTLIPTTWLLVLPGGNYYWMWQYANALETVSYRRIKASDTFLLYIIATCFLLFGSFHYNFDFGNNNANKFPGTHAILLILLIAGIFLWLLQIAGWAMFCAVMQKKINRIAANSPSMPGVNLPKQG